MATINAVGVGLSGASGTGNFAGTTSPTFITPTLGAAAATSINFGGSTLQNYVSTTSWTPTFTFGTPGNLSVSYSVQAGFYTRIGSVVYYTASLTCTPTFTTASGPMTIAGLPVTVATINALNQVQLSTAGYTYPTGTTSPVAIPINSSNTVQIGAQGTGVGYMGLTTASIVSGVQISLTVQGFYFV